MMLSLKLFLAWLFTALGLGAEPGATMQPVSRVEVPEQEGGGGDNREERGSYDPRGLVPEADYEPISNGI